MSNMVKDNHARKISHISTKFSLVDKTIQIVTVYWVCLRVTNRCNQSTALRIHNFISIKPWNPAIQSMQQSAETVSHQHISD